MAGSRARKDHPQHVVCLDGAAASSTPCMGSDNPVEACKLHIAEEAFDISGSMTAPAPIPRATGWPDLLGAKSPTREESKSCTLHPVGPEWTGKESNQDHCVVVSPLLRGSHVSEHFPAGLGQSLSSRRFE
mmetsp:Transcript_1029/g.2551  ORF Transcript_1029/g.2551 Transcript_1029/m.2551 type:complete len:131 (-) Transcript_1029:833-1225(-)